MKYNTTFEMKPLSLNVKESKPYYFDNEPKTYDSDINFNMEGITANLSVEMSVEETIEMLAKYPEIFGMIKDLFKMSMDSMNCEGLSESRLGTLVQEIVANTIGDIIRTEVQNAMSCKCNDEVKPGLIFDEE